MLSLCHSFPDAAVRETMEEGGIKIQIAGILRLEHTPSKHGARMRMIFYAHPVDDNQKPKTVPDEESEEARWVTSAEFKEIIKTNKLRGEEPLFWWNYIEKGGPVYPMTLFGYEGEML